MGLLLERPRHPYDIAYTMQARHLDAHIKLSLGSLYHAVEQLERQGMVRPTETTREGRRPERTVYAVTPEGRDCFLRHLRQLIAEPAPEYSRLEAGLSFLYELGAEEAAQLLRRRAASLREQADLVDYSLERHHERGLTRLVLIEVELAQAERRFQADWVEGIAREIESGTLAWSRPDVIQEVDA
jgi:DNA-binding PadR family transcriptional regulator